MDFLKPSDARSLAIAYIGAVRLFVARVLQNAAASIAPEHARHTFGAATSSLRPPTMRITPTPCFLQPTVTAPVPFAGSEPSWLLLQAPGLRAWALIGLLLVVLALAALSCFLAASCANLQKQVAAYSAALIKEARKATCNLDAHKDIEDTVVALINALDIKAPYQDIHDIPWMVNKGRPRRHNTDGTALVLASVNKYVAADPDDHKSGYIVKREIPVKIPPPRSEPLGPEPYPWHQFITEDIDREWQPYQFR
ncbi:MAG: hypothetical protein M1831_000182 [Alyxoria varia]|nr:MAG: hypothetical protein M1831_000182 [Alyxoria varia]